MPGSAALSAVPVAFSLRPAVATALELVAAAAAVACVFVSIGAGDTEHAQATAIDAATAETPATLALRKTIALPETGGHAFDTVTGYRSPRRTARPLLVDR